MSNFDEVFQLVQYDPNSTGVLPDSINEISAILNRDSDEAAQLVKRMLDNYHYRVAGLPADMPHEIFMLVAVITQPFRIAPVRNDGFAMTRGLKPADPQLYHLRRARPIRGSIAEERETISTELYRLSLRYSDRTKRWCAAALSCARVFRKDVATSIANNLFDNYAIKRLSANRLETLSKSVDPGRALALSRSWRERDAPKVQSRHGEKSKWGWIVMTFLSSRILDWRLTLDFSRKYSTVPSSDVAI